MSTSDERREIARRLRAAAKTKSNSADYLWKRLEIAVNGWKFGDVIDESYVFDNDVLARLADLIDPTCEMTDASWDNGECTWGCICSACGAHIEHEKGRFLDYCPNCGARVVSCGDR